MDETAQRILGRKWADDVLADNATASEPFRFGFRRRMLAEFKVNEIDRGAMTDAQSREFGAETIQFGKHAGMRYDEVPLDYLEWLADQNAKLVRYVRSRRVQEEQGVMPEE